jgi:hypothetical protein
LEQLLTVDGLGRLLTLRTGAANADSLDHRGELPSCPSDPGLPEYPRPVSTPSVSTPYGAVLLRMVIDGTCAKLWPTTQ